MSSRLTTLLSLIWMFLFSSQIFALDNTFDHQHTLWNKLLHKHVHWINNGKASQVDYRAFKQDEPQLEKYIASLSATDKSDFDRWSRNQRKAFLLNAYNAFTIKLILSRYPEVESIKDFGSLFSSPWSKRFFSLFGKPANLDEIEHEMLRKPGAYDDPYIHVSVVCASIGCPALPNEAFTADKIDRQLNENMIRFLSDHSRNRFNPQSGELEISKIFDWYEKDFEQGNRQLHSIKDLFSRFSNQISDAPQQQQLIKNRQVEITYLNYDWRLNDYTHKK
ncbi:MAG: DUF547 domain-containing protein [Chromatiales bacterium]|nr:DUF547 domain-containing protein [Chromatiales bacterium]